MQKVTAIDVGLRLLRRFDKFYFLEEKKTRKEQWPIHPPTTLIGD